MKDAEGNVGSNFAAAAVVDDNDGGGEPVLVVVVVVDPAAVLVVVGCVNDLSLFTAASVLGAAAIRGKEVGADVAAAVADVAVTSDIRLRFSRRTCCLLGAPPLHFILGSA